ncbi:hypothetical protein EMIT0324P_10188 [Pseudomonas chlororaphis]
MKHVSCMSSLVEGELWVRSVMFEVEG